MSISAMASQTAPIAFGLTSTGRLNRKRRRNDALLSEKPLQLLELGGSVSHRGDWRICAWTVGVLNMDGLHEYAFDVTLLTTLRVRAGSLQEAKDKLRKRLDCATINLGVMDGQAIVAEASMEGEPDLFEFDGEPANDVNGKIEIGD